MKSTAVHFLFVILFVLVGYQSKSQVLRNFYYDEYWQLSKNNSTTKYRRESLFDSVNQVYEGVIRDFTMDGKLVMTGVYKKGIKDGEFIFHFDNGQVESIGIFKKNIRTGVWKYFYSNGTPKTEIEFLEQPKIIFFNDSTGNRLLENGNGKWIEQYKEFLFPSLIVIEGFYKDGLRSGEWTCKSEGLLIYSEKFDKGIFLSGIRYDVNKPYSEEWENKFLLPYKFRVTEALKAKKDVYLEDYTFIASLHALGKEVFVVVESQPEFPGGYEALNGFIEKNLHYPNSKQKESPQRVFVGFVVNIDGAISDVQVVKGVSPELDAEAMRVVSLFPKWKPGMQHGKTVRVKFILPIRFR